MKTTTTISLLLILSISANTQLPHTVGETIQHIKLQKAKPGSKAYDVLSSHLLNVWSLEFADALKRMSRNYGVAKLDYQNDFFPCTKKGGNTPNLMIKNFVLCIKDKVLEIENTFPPAAQQTFNKTHVLMTKVIVHSQTFTQAKFLKLFDYTYKSLEDV